MVQTIKNLPAMQETWVPSLGQEDPLEKRMTTHSSILAWEILWTEEPGRLQSMSHKESDTTAQLTLPQGLSIRKTTQEMCIRYIIWLLQRGATAKDMGWNLLGSCVSTCLLN